MAVSTVSQDSVFAKLMDGAWLKHPKLKAAGLTVLARDNFTCQSCGFRSRPASSSGVPHGWMIPASLGHPGYLPVEVKDSKTYCPFCLASRAVNWAVKPQVIGSRELIAPGIFLSFPDLTQVQINLLALNVVSVLASVKIGSSKSAVEASAQAINNAMRGRQSVLESDFPVYRAGQDFALANGLALLPVDLYRDREKVMGMVRWWPNVEYWEEQGIYWNKASYK